MASRAADVTPATVWIQALLTFCAKIAIEARFTIFYFTFWKTDRRKQRGENHSFRLTHSFSFTPRFSVFVLNSLKYFLSFQNSSALLTWTHLAEEKPRQTALQRDEKKNLNFPLRDLLVIKRLRVYLGRYFMSNKNTCSTGLFLGGGGGAFGGHEWVPPGVYCSSESLSVSLSLQREFLHTSDLQKQHIWNLDSEKQGQKKKDIPENIWFHPPNSGFYIWMN